MTPPPPCPIDVLDPRFYDDPWDAYRWLRRHSPIHWDERNELWVISRHADVSHISRNQELYSAAAGVRPGSPRRCRSSRWTTRSTPASAG